MSNPSQHNKGITLIEVILILMILAILVSIAIRINITKTPPLPLPNKNQNALLIIENAMKWYKLDNGCYPTTQQGIRALMIKPTIPPIPQHWVPYLTSIPLNQNGQPFHYTNQEPCARLNNMAK